MRTKKILSVLLAILTMMSAFGIVGASAVEGTVTEQVAGVAQSVWPSPVELEKVTSGSWDTAVFQWTPFTYTTEVLTNSNGTTTTVSNNDSFYELYKLSVPKASVIWKVSHKDANGTWVELPVYATAAAAVGKPIQIYSYDTGSKIQLIIKQGTAATYGDFKVTLTVTSQISGPVATTTATETRTSVEEPITLSNPTDINKLLSKADGMVGKTDRYTEQYIDLLKQQIAACRLYTAAKPNQDVLNSVQAELQKVINYVDDPASAPLKVYKLFTSDGEGFDKIFSQGFLKIWYKIADFFSGATSVLSKLSELFKPVVDLFGSIGKAFGFLVPLITAIGKLLGIG